MLFVFNIFIFCYFCTLWQAQAIPSRGGSVGPSVDSLCDATACCLGVLVDGVVDDYDLCALFMQEGFRTCLYIPRHNMSMGMDSGGLTGRYMYHKSIGINSGGHTGRFIYHDITCRWTKGVLTRY